MLPRRHTGLAFHAGRMALYLVTPQQGPWFHRSRAPAHSRCATAHAKMIADFPMTLR